MQRLAFLLSGEHDTFPPSEVIASIEAEEFDYEILEELDQLLIIKTDADVSTLARRLGMCHWIGEHFCTVNKENLIEAIGSSDLIDFLPQSKSIALRVKKIKKYFPDTDAQKLTEEIADRILEEFDYKIDLEHPKNEIFIVLTNGKCVVNIVKERINRTAFLNRKPPKRAAVHPTTMQPNLARALVNLARTPQDGTFLDPFCGVGGIMIEAGMIGATLTGGDINKNLIEGARKNLEEFGIKKFNLIKSDFRKLEISKKFDAIATDPPYGRQASTGGSDLKELYKDIIPLMVNALKRKRYLCITSPAEINLEEFVENQPLKLKEIHNQRVHRSLARKIYVFQREKE